MRRSPRIREITLRRYMIDQMNSDYVKFARSGGLTEGEIFTKHILKNAVIPIVHGIPGSILSRAQLIHQLILFPGHDDADGDAHKIGHDSGNNRSSPSTS